MIMMSGIYGKELTWEEVFDRIDARLCKAITGHIPAPKLVEEMYRMFEGYEEWYLKEKEKRG